MTALRIVGGLLLMASSAGLFGQAGANPGRQATGPETVIAEVGGHKVTLSDLEQGMADRLFQARQQYYAAERAALEQYLDDEVLAAEARRQNLSVKELLERNVDAHVTDPSDDQLRVYYEGVNTDQPFEAVRDKVLQHIREQRLAKAKAAYVKSLREQAGVLVTFAPPVADVNSGDGPVHGPKNAPVRLVEFADFQCPYCQQVHPEIKKLLEHFGDQVSFSYRDYPLPMHPQAPKAAEAARCAGAQGKFWEFHDALFADKKLAPADLKEEARKLSLDTAVFDKCLDSGEQAAAVEKDASKAQHLGVTGTPTFFINGHQFTGPAKYDTFVDAINKELAVVSGKIGPAAMASSSPASNATVIR